MLCLILKFISHTDAILGTLLQVTLFGTIVFVLAGLKYFLWDKPRRKVIERKKNAFSKKYPLNSCDLPLQILEIGDKITFSDKRVVTYGGNHKDKYTVWGKDKYGASQEIILSEDVLISNSLIVTSDLGLKWEKPDTK